MTGLIGADVDELVSLGKSLDQAADRMESIRGEIGSAFDRSQWEGDDAQHFRDLWRHQLSGQLLQTASATRVAATVLARNAQQQVQASSSDNGPVQFLGSLGATGAGDPGGVEPWDPLTSKPVDWFMKGVGVTGGLGTILKGVGDLAKDGRIVKAGEALGGAAEKFDGVAAFVDGWKLGSAIANHDSDGTKAAAVDIVADATFKGLEVATAGCPPLFIAVGVADVGWQFVPEKDKVAIANAAIDVAHDVGNVAGAVGQGYVDAATSVGHGVADAAGTAGAIVSSGLSGAKKLLHW